MKHVNCNQKSQRKTHRTFKNASIQTQVKIHLQVNRTFFQLSEVVQIEFLEFQIYMDSDFLQILCVHVLYNAVHCRALNTLCKFCMHIFIDLILTLTIFYFLLADCAADFELFLWWYFVRTFTDGRTNCPLQWIGCAFIFAHRIAPVPSYFFYDLLWDPCFKETTGAGCSQAMVCEFSFKTSTDCKTFYSCTNGVNTHGPICIPHPRHWFCQRVQIQFGSLGNFGKQRTVLVIKSHRTTLGVFTFVHVGGSWLNFTAAKTPLVRLCLDVFFENETCLSISIFTYGDLWVKPRTSQTPVLFPTTQSQMNPKQIQYCVYQLFRMVFTENTLSPHFFLCVQSNNIRTDFTSKSRSGPLLHKVVQSVIEICQRLITFPQQLPKKFCAFQSAFESKEPSGTRSLVGTPPIDLSDFGQENQILQFARRIGNSPWRVLSIGRRCP